jgi:Ca2+-transporting ATPase
LLTFNPPRPESKEAITRARSADIEVVMITGDNAVTARAIGESVGLMKPGDTILSGQEVDQLSDEELSSRLSTVRIFSRTTPFQKARIVGLYQALGEVVAVTGDGVNDAIALKKSDVGVAMGRIGSDVARETADMVITDDNFATIVNAIEEGRNIIKNVKNAVTYLLSCNIAEAVIVILSVAIGLPHILFAIQLLYINLITDGVPALALAFSPRQKGVMMRGPERNQSVLIKSDVV